MNYRNFAASVATTLMFVCGCASFTTNATENPNLERARQTLDSIYRYYSAPGTHLLRENYPTDSAYRATYGASIPGAANPYSYLWPFSGTLTANAALLEATGDTYYAKQIEERVLPGLEEYFDMHRIPAAYASYIKSAPESDRFYDDNIWIGIDFADLYMASGNKSYLNQSVLVWNFIESGVDDKLGGGIYWCEQVRKSKNTCSNAPGAVYALKLYQATGRKTYLSHGRTLYEWTRNRLMDPTDSLYFDNVNLAGEIDNRKFAYNSGQMIQAAVLLYNATGEQQFLDDARSTAAAAANHFFRNHPDPEAPVKRVFSDRNTWFTAVMLRGFIELYKVDKDRKYIDLFQQNLDYAWTSLRNDKGLFHTDFSGRRHNRRHWLLTQAAMVEMYARLGALESK